ncbi:P-loop containing nucleoside triphosphate hydrolase [Pseudocohnilembus persalinus]|uniref:p-loop containing nucleoside triphosphate hydrolase n=1 Tax=Pseudocohnilembus persalinus TaxID=266149 RepID=A0A0V0QD95_PSEPJ|nr:P-loop containing nucleoside triphosphate hydrolase [Pseudocohnilembus persalinus]|eukprot:KRX00189.1 P-loop containing nucleoside triphosphate hydrolase [Pseudocohnilembus persalinus]
MNGIISQYMDNHQESPIASGLRVINPGLQNLQKQDLFPNYAMIKFVKCPIFVMHGDNDKELQEENPLQNRQAQHIQQTQKNFNTRHKKSLSESNLLHMLDQQQGSYNLFSQNPPQDIFKMFIREREDSGMNFQTSIVNQLLTPIQGPAQVNTLKNNCQQQSQEKNKQDQQKTEKSDENNTEKNNFNDNSSKKEQQQEKKEQEGRDGDIVKKSELNQNRDKRQELEQTDELPELQMPEQALSQKKELNRDTSIHSDDSKDYFENNPRLKANPDQFNYSYSNYENQNANQEILMHNQFKKLMLDSKQEEIKSQNNNLGSLKDLSMANFNFNANNNNNNQNFQNSNVNNLNSNQFIFSQNQQDLNNSQQNKKAFLNQPQFSSVNNLNNKKNDLTAMYPMGTQYNNPNSMMNLEAFSLDNNKQKGQKPFIPFLDGPALSTQSQQQQPNSNHQQNLVLNKHMSEANTSPYLANNIPPPYNLMQQQQQQQQQLSQQNLNLQKNNSFSYTNPQSPYVQGSQSDNNLSQFKFPSQQQQVGNSQFATMQPQFGNSPIHTNLMNFNQSASQQDLDVMSTQSAQQQIQMQNPNIRQIGRLKFFDEVKNYGFLIMDDGSDIFVHYDDLQKANISKEVLKQGKSGSVIKFSFKCLNYIGRHNRSRKAVELQYIPNEGELGNLQLQQSQSTQLPHNNSFLSPNLNTSNGAFNFQQANFSQFGSQQQLQTHQPQVPNSQQQKTEQRTQSPFMNQQMPFSNNINSSGTQQQMPQQQQGMQDLTQEQIQQLLQHEKAIEKYRNYEGNKLNQHKLTEMISGEQQNQYVNKPGEYFIVTTGKDTAKGAHLDIPLQDLLDRPQTAKFSLGSQADIIQEDKTDQSYFSKPLNNEEYANLVIQDPESKSFMSRNIKNVIRKQHISFMSPSSKIIKDIVDKNVKQDGETDKNIKTQMNRVKSAKILPLKKLSVPQIETTMSEKGERPLSSTFMIKTMKNENVKKIEQSNKMKQVMDYDKVQQQKIDQKKKTSYIVYKKNKVVQHIKGYNTVTLTDQDIRPSINQKSDISNKTEQINNQNQYNKNKIPNQTRPQSAIDPSKQSPFIKGNFQAEVEISKRLGLPLGPIKEEEKEDKAGYFLPLDYYNLDDEDIDPSISMQEAKQYSTDGNIWGESKWFANDGTFTWKKCLILGWLEEQSRFKIQWENGKTKLVSRVNLKFKYESKEKFDKKLQAAEYYREMSEIFLKYNYMIDSMQSKSSQLNLEAIERILYFTANFSYKLGELRNINQFFNLDPSIKYNFKRYLIPKQIITNNMKPQEIFKKKKYSTKLVEQVIEEIKNCFIRANHQIEFNNSFPFNEERQNMFKGFLPDELFLDPITWSQQKEVKQNALLPLTNEKINTKKQKIEFIKLVNQMNEKIHSANSERLKILQTLQKELENYQKIPFVLTKFKHIWQFEEFKKSTNQLYNDRARDLYSKLLDTNFEVMDIVDEHIKLVKAQNEQKLRTIVTVEERKKIQEEVLSKEIISSLLKFQNMLNLQFERAARDTFDFSMKQFEGYFEPILKAFRRANNLSEDFEINSNSFNYEYLINYQYENQNGEIYKPGSFQAQIKVDIVEIQPQDSDKKIKQIEINPPIEEWQEYLYGLFSCIVARLRKVACMKVNSIGPARKSEFLQVFFETDDHREIKDQMYDHHQKQTKNLLDQVFFLVHAFKDKIQKFLPFVQQTNETLKKSMKKINNFKEFEEEIHKIKSANEEIQKVFFNDEMTVGIFAIQVGNYKQFLEKQIEKASKYVYQNLVSKIKLENDKIQKETQIIMQRLDEKPQNLEKLDALRYYCNVTLEDELFEIQQKIRETMEKLDLFEVMWEKITQENFIQTWTIYGLPLELRIKRGETLDELRKLQDQFSSSLTQDQDQIILDIKEINYELDLITKEKNINNFTNIYQKFAILGEKIQQCLSDAEVINRREKILKWRETDYKECEKIEQKWTPYYSLWKHANDFQFEIVINALESPINALNSSHITEFILNGFQDLGKLEKKEFKSLPEMKYVTQQIRKKYEDFKIYLPLINDIRNPNLKQSHWQRINNTIKEYNEQQEDPEKKLMDVSLKNIDPQPLQIDDEQNITLQTLIESGILILKEEIRDISEVATKEKGFERQMQKMKNDWKPIKLELSGYKDTGTFILKSVDPIMDKLDEDISKTLSIASSPYIKFLERDVIQWRDNLFKMQETLEAWLKVQKMWCYLQPIFYSEDIIKEMQKEGNKYQVVNLQWFKIMSNTIQQPQAMEACTQNKLKENFYQMIESLEQVIKGLNEYLNKKRQLFPRFYFLSNDELLQILAQTREPRAVQRHMPKCFEGIDHLTFQNDMSVTHMNSVFAEEIQFLQAVNPLDRDKNPRGVEEWLQEIENQMKSTLKEKLKQTLSVYDEKKRQEWLLQHPSQLVVTSDQAIWTARVTEAIQKVSREPQSLKQEKETLENLLQQIVAMVRTKSKKIEMITLGVLIVIEVHQIRVVEELIEQSVHQTDSFEWLMQMRYYQEEKGMFVKMISTQREYGYEYLGNQGRLVITPLTNRCFRTLMSALHLNLGGAPEGPAGTGKTETTKDLAKAIAKHCVVFNCSDQLDYKAMGKFFKGLTSCGSWACFDEFNRIELEVLSVIAQQIWKIQNSIHKQSLQKFPTKEFLFEGDMVKLDPTCAIFITMNPGYQGRSELPDNLKALFRPVAMMIPNYAMITEISLFSYGFSNARDLSVKITTSLKLASEQLSTQSHYDFGMRAIKAIIVAAGNLKRAFPYENESYLCLRAIGDCNLPKFTSQDVPLFQSIIKDLFPDIEQKEQNFGELSQSIKSITKQQNLVLKDRFFQKILELYETIKVRHGLMVVGKAACGKTTIITTLQKSIERVNIKQALLKSGKYKKDELEFDEIQNDSEDSQKEEPENVETFLRKNSKIQEDDFANQQVNGSPKNENQKQRRQSIFQNKKEIKNLKYKKVDLYMLNPKSITTKMLFGDFDEAGEWHNGITANLFRECQDKQQAQDTQGLNWIIFDGPVDALWIENMNTVLDDNKKLCLTNGETIKLVDDMNIIFEVEDLLEASPATVSRCGMVYMENKDLGWKVLFEPWFYQLEKSFQTIYHKQLFTQILDELVEPVMESYFNDNLKSSLKVTRTWLAANFLKMFQCFNLKGLSKKDYRQQQEQNQEKLEAKLKAEKLQGKDVKELRKSLYKIQDLNDKDKGEFYQIATQALIWSLGASLEEESRQKFNLSLQKTVQNFQKENPAWIQASALPSTDFSVYDQRYDFYKKHWTLWKQGPDYKIPKSVTHFHEIFIPTNDSIRHHYVLKTLVENEYPCLFAGKTGTGKTTIMKKFLLNDLEPLPFRTTTTSFSANTTCSQVQDILESKLEKTKRKRGVFGPLIGYTNIIFIDDLNMPNKEKFGAQPPLELIRQWFSARGWYDRKQLEFNTIVDIQFAACMGTGRPPLSNRLLRHFSLVYLNEMQDETLFTIVKKVFEWGFEEYVDKIKFLISEITGFCIHVHKSVCNSFLPLPSKSHYVFNLRDLMKVVQGVLNVPANQYEAQGENRNKLFRLWYHETLCVYSDRLVDQNDRQKFQNICEQTLQEEGRTSIEDIITCIDPQSNEKKQHHLLYGNFMDNQVYSEIEDPQKAKEIILDSIENYNKNNKNKINIVLFEDALKMLCKINRIISSPFGHALLIGLGGSGSHTLTRLASYLQEYQTFEIELEADFGNSDWLEFLRVMLRDLVMKDQGGVFLIGDAQLISEKFLEDINNLLNIGEIPNLYPQDDKESMLQDIKDKHRLNNITGQMALWEYFVTKCKTNLHITACLSPIGDKLRTRLRNFPSLISCTSPIWVESWSEEALKEVAYHKLNEQAEEMQLDPEKIEKISQIYLTFQTSVQNITQDYFQETGKRFYVTPTLYLKLLNNFQLIYQSKLDELVLKKKTYENGVKKLEECNKQVENLKDQIENMQPQLAQQTIETEEKLKLVEKESSIAEQQKIKVQADEEDTATKAEKATKIQNQCKEALGEAEPKLLEAINALKTLKQTDLVEMKATQKPPSGIRMTFDAICIMLNQKGKKGEKGAIEYWDDARHLLKDPAKFLKKLEDYPKDNIPENVIQKMKLFLAQRKDKFTPKVIRNASIACEGLCKWVLAIYDYHWVYQSILPLRQDLSEANEQLETATKELQKTRQELYDLEMKCQNLQDQFTEANTKKQKLNAEIQNCKLKLERAQELTSNLSNEQVRWKESSQNLKTEITNLLGDVLLAVGSLSYLGAFTGEFRQKLVKNIWIPKILASNIYCNKEFSLVQRLGNPVQILEWELQGLPLDQVSKENAIIMKQSDNWPLLIDPQNQAKKWITKMQESIKDSKPLMIAKPGQKLDKKLEICIREGRPLLVDGVGETIPPVLEAVMLKSNLQVQQGKKIVQIGLTTVEYDDDFQLYLICNMPNPHYTPETLTKVTLLNFNITLEAAKDQMLSLLAREEDEGLENEKIRIMNESAENAAKMAQIESNILQQLATTEPEEMLEDDKLINELKESKKTSTEIEQRQKEAQGTEEKIKQMRINYSSVAQLAAEIYFTVTSLQALDPMYQFSFEFYARIYIKSIKSAEKVQKSKLEHRIKNLKESLKKCIYFEMQRALFVKHKLLFSLMLGLTILKCDEKFDEKLHHFMLSGLSGKQIELIENPDQSYFSDKQWTNILHLGNLQAFPDFAPHLIENLDIWKQYLDNISQPNAEQPQSYKQLTPFEKLVLTRAVKPQLFVEEVNNFVVSVCGPHYIENIIISLEKSFEESQAQIPLIFLLTPGDDPQDDLKRFAQEKGKYITFQSLGKGQGEAAEAEIRETMQTGQWILLQNCHLAVSWLPRLEEIMEELNSRLQKKDREINPEFRIWLTSMSSDQFPMQLLQNGIKMTKDPPKGVKQNVLQLYYNMSATKEEVKYFESCSAPEEWRKLVMSLSFFHAIIRERRRYGPIGWNIYYDFNQSDFQISRSQLKYMLENYQEIPYKALIYLTGECYYGGKVTDDWDRRVILALLSDFYNTKATSNNYQFSPLKNYVLPADSQLENLDLTIEYLNSLEETNNPELFGLHKNATISSATVECAQIMQSLLDIASSSQSQKGGDKNELLKNRAQEILLQLPEQFDAIKVREQFKIEYFESMNTVLIQEILRYNTLLEHLQTTLNDLIAALGGMKVMTQTLENLSEGLQTNMIPSVWISKSYPSLKSLISYIQDLNKRVDMFQQWIQNGKAPSVFWLPGFYFTQSFFTGVRQNHARKHTIPIDQINFDFNMRDDQDDFDTPPENGCYITGLYIEGARWDYGRHRLEEPFPNVIYEPMPIIQFVPITGKRKEIQGYYEAPTYKTTERKGTLSTTGHSTNFILSVYLATKVDPSHWVKRGVALLAALSD